MVIKHKNKVIYTLLLLIISGFILLTVFVLLDPIPKVDRQFSEEVQEHNNPWLDHLMRAISWAGYMPNSMILIVGTAVLFWLFHHRREALFTLLTALSGLVSTLIKFLVNRPRPLPNLVRVIEKTQQQSFPSGHVLFYTVFFGFLIIVVYNIKRLSNLLRCLFIGFFFLIILLIPLSRIYLGAHWFTDVTAGFLMGLLCLYGLTWFYLKSGADSNYKNQAKNSL